MLFRSTGEKRALAAISLATMIICAVGVFIDISVITVAPIALAIGKKAGYHKEALLLAMIGGGKAGNIISPNPNTIAVSEAFKVDLTSLMMKNFIPAICAVVVTILLSTMLSKKQGVQVTENDLEQKEDKNLPSFIQAVAGPVVAVMMYVDRKSTRLNSSHPSSSRMPSSA